MSFVSSQPHPPMGGQKVMMKAPPGMVAANGKKVMMMPHGAMPPAGAMMVGGGKKMMAAPPPGSQMMLGKSMMSTASSMPAGSTSMRFTSPPGGGVKKMIAMPPQGAAVKMVKSMAPSAGGPSPGQSMMSHAGSGGTGVGAARPGPAASAPAFTVVNGKKMMLPPGAKIMSPPGPMGQKLPMGSNSNSSGVFNGAPGGGGSASLPNAGARPTATTPAAPGHGGAGVVPLSAMETRTGASPSGKPTAEPDKKKRHSLFSFLHIGSSSDEDEGAAAALSPARPQPMSATAATATAPSAMQGKKIMTDAPAGALSSAMPPGTGQPQPMMKKMMMPASGLPPAGAVATGKQPVSILQKKMPGAPAQGGAQGSSPPAASGVKFISMPSGNQNGYGGNMSLASSMVNMARTSGSAGSTAQSMPAGAASAAANTSASTAQSQSPEPDAVSDELMHSTTTLERMAAAAAAAASEAPSDGGTKPQPAATGMASSIQSTAPTATPAPAGGGAAAGRSASPNSGGLRVASSTRLGGEASTSLESAGVAHAAAAGGGSGGASTSATRKAPIKRLNGRFSAFTVTDSDEDSSAQEEEPQPAPGADGATTSVSRDQVSSSSRSLTPAERASGGSPAADKNSTDEDEGAGSPAPSEDAVSVNSAAPRADGEAALGKSLSTKLSLPSLAGSTQPPHTRQVSRDVSKGAHVNLASQSKSKVTSRVKPAPRPTATAASSTRAKAPPTPPSPAKKKKTTTPTPLRNRSSPVSAPARASSAAEKKKKQQPTTATRTTARQASVSTLGGDDDDDKGVAETDSTRSTIMVNKDDEEDDNTHVAHSESGKDGGTDADQNTDNANDHVRQDGARREKVKAQKVSTSQRERRHQPDNSVNSDETDGSAADEATPALSGRDLYRLVALLKKEESRDASGGGVRSSSRTRSRTRGRLGRRGSGEAEREPDAWDRLGRGGGEEARFREPYAVHLHSTREIIGSPGIPWRYTDKHAGSEPFPPAPSVARPLGVINIGGGRYAALRTRGESSPYSLARTAGGGGGASMSMTSSPQRHSTPLSSRPARLRSQSANDADMYGHGRSSTPPGRDRYTSAIMDDLSHSAIRAAQVHALGLPGPRRGTVGSLSPGSAMLEEVHPYCSSPPRPLLSSIPVSRGDVHVRAGGGLRTSDEEPRLQPSAGHALPTSSTRESSPGKTRQEPTFFDVNRQMYFGTSLSTPTSPLRASSGGGGGGGGMLQRRERLLVSPVRDEPASRTGPNVVSHGPRDSPLLFRPPTAASSTSPSSTRGRKGRGRSLSASQVPKPKPQPPSLIPNSVAAARSASQPTRTQSPRQGKPTQARLTPEAIERLAAPPARSASAPRTYREYVARGQHSRGRGTRGVGSSQATAASRCGHWVDEVLSAMSESQQDAGGAESTRPVVQIPRVDLRSEFKPVILNDADDEDTRRRKLSLALASTTADADPSSTLIIGSRARAHVPGLSFKHMTGIRSPQRSGRSRIATTTTAAGAGDGDTSVSASHEKSAVVVVANMSPAEGMPFDKYSTVTVKDPQRPSAWALTPERNAEFGGVLPGQAAVRRVVRRRDGTATDGEDAAEEGMYVTVEEVHLDEFKRPYVVIKRVPCGAAAERQKEVSKRLSIPRRRFVRAEDNEGPAKA